MADDQTAPATDPEDKLVSIPQSALAILWEELAGRSDCGGEHAEPGCPICDAIALAREACK